MDGPCRASLGWAPENKRPRLAEAYSRERRETRPKLRSVKDYGLDARRGNLARKPPRLSSLSLINEVVGVLVRQSPAFQLEPYQAGGGLGIGFAGCAKARNNQ